MKNINILSLVQAHDSLQKQSYKAFLSYYGIKIRTEEIKDLASLVEVLTQSTDRRTIFNQFYVGYSIPQIGKEFDLLRFGKECIINIELKKTATHEKIQTQLIRNKYYLSFTEKKVHSFCYQSDIGQLFSLNDNGELKKADFIFLIKLLMEQQVEDISNIDTLFNPSAYLVSPFNATEKFLNGEYFLTKQQEKVRSEVLESIEDKATCRFISITGSAGTGKTLLTYDVAKELISNGKSCLIIHCGLLNNGQHTLNGKHGWNIISIKYYASYTLTKYDVVVIDEAQRIQPEQLDDIVQKIQSVNGKCIFSYDKLQTLASWEDKRNIDDCINKINLIVTHKLTEKIRTNKEIASFIKALFNRNSAVKLMSKDNIEVNYFNSVEDAVHYMRTLDDTKWEVLRFTPSQFNSEHHKKYSDLTHKTSHQIIGQEFDNVVITIDTHFDYDENGKLNYKGGIYYDAAKMLFQNITRTRKRLNIVIINNSNVLDRCLAVLHDSEPELD